MLYCRNELTQGFSGRSEIGKGVYAQKGTGGDLGIEDRLASGGKAKQK